MSEPLLFPASPLLLATAWLPGLALALLCWGVVVHGLQKMRASDDLVALSWWLGLALALGSGLAGVPLWVLASYGPPGGGLPLLRLGSLGSLWLVAVVSTGLVMGLARHVEKPWPRRLGQATLLGLQHWLSVQLALRDLDRQWAPDGTDFPLSAGPAAGALLLAAGALAALSLPPADTPPARRRRMLLGMLLFGLGAGAALLLSWPQRVLPLAWEGGHGLVLDGLTLRLLAGSASMTLLLGTLVSQIDRLAHGRGVQLSRSLNQANQKLREQALVDPLTRLPNRTQFEERLEEALLRAEQGVGGLAVLFLDLDGFKPVNDSFGHVAGDTVLREMSRRLRAAVRPGDLVARVGGDEFLALCERPGDDAGAAQIARRLLQLCSQPCTLPNTVEVKLSCSIGIVMFPKFGPPQKLIAQADAAMYAAKRAGGSTFAFYEPRMEQDTRNQLELQNDLRGALERSELELFYQPKIDGRSGQITGVEALVRWHHPARGLVMPGTFIPIAERFGLIGRLGDWVIEESCRQLRQWRDQGLRMRVAINMSAHQLRDVGLAQRMQEAMRRHSVEPSQLTIEIIESVLMEDAAVTSFSGLADLGVGLSIDDFGIGYCNFALLRKLPVKQLKVDRSLFTDIHDSADARSVVVAIVRMAHALNLRVVAEGVETETQRDMLLALQCDELQGYLFAKPMSAAKLTLWAMSDEHQPDDEGEFRPSTFMESGATKPALLR